MEDPNAARATEILAVDDNVANLLALEAVLEPLGVPVVQVLSGTAALEHILRRGHAVAVMLLDVHMPELDGFETARLIRGRKSLAQLPIMFVTAVKREEANILKGYAEGAIDYVVKPFNPDVLRTKVAFFVQAHQRAVASGKDLLVSQDKLALALEAANLGVWNWNVSEQRVTSDERCRVMLGLGPTQQVSLTSFGLPPIESAGDGARLQGEHRTADGRWLFTQARVYRRGKDAYVVGIVADITEDKESVLERELFVGVLGHDLRNPLSAISLQADRLAEHRDAAIKGAAERIGRASARMSSLISDMLDFVGSRRGPLPLTLGATSLDDICREVVAEIEVATPGVDIALRPGNPNGGTWDAARLNQVVQNLITNAARHSEPDSTVRVDVSERGDAAILEVHNGGKPIPDNLRQRMFDPFVSASGGPGLGLYITKRLVEAHGGMLEVESTEGGTTLRATLPRHPAP